MKLNKNRTKILGVILVSFALISLHADENNPRSTAKTQSKAELKSPIDFSFPQTVEFSYTKPFNGTIKVVHEDLSERNLSSEYMVQIDPTEGAIIDGNDIVVDGDTYHLIQFHFHVPSEHTVNGKRARAEVHFVHQSDSKKLAVVGAFIIKGAMNAAYQALLNQFPKSSKELSSEESLEKKMVLKEEICIAKLLPLRHSCIFRYLGGKTSGDLAPAVKWIVLTNPIEFSKSQLETLEPIASEGSYTQPLLGRSVSIIPLITLPFHNIRAVED